GVGDLGAAILAATPEAFRGAIEPFIAQIVSGIHQAFSLAVAQTFWIGVASAIVAAVAAVFMIEHPLRADAPVTAPATAPATGKATPEAQPSLGATSSTAD
ncbi:MAG: hypothetical protein QOI52_220, partial [Chloroflexota bacterium]|nr:hypothetical protein [Chloroflexota bacterium]